MIGDIIQYLIDSGLFAGYAYTDWRDDSSYPFKQDIPIVLIRTQGGQQDADIGMVGVDIYLHTSKNASNSDRGALINTATELDSYLANNSTFENVQYVDVISTYSGPFKDAQERYLTAHRITLRRSGV